MSKHVLNRANGHALCFPITRASLAESVQVEGDKLYVYGEMSNSKGKVVRFKIKRSQNRTMYGTVPPDKKPEAN